MKTKILFPILFALAILQFGACTDDPKNKPKPQSAKTQDNMTDKEKEKLEQDKKTLQTLLVSQKDGWKTTYIPKKEGTGGFNLLLKFTTETAFTVATDQNKDSSQPADGKYELKVEKGVNLLIAPGTVLDALLKGKADPKLKEKEVDNVFSYIEVREGDLIFKNTKSGQELRLSKATADDWKKIADLFKMEDIISKCKILTVKNDKVETKYSLTFDKSARALTGTTKVDQKETKTIFGLAFTPTGIVIIPPLEVGDKKLSAFELNTAGKDQTFDAKEGDKITAVIKK